MYIQKFGDFFCLGGQGKLFFEMMVLKWDLKDK